jgi:hypothetical protein
MRLLQKHKLISKTVGFFPRMLSVRERDEVRKIIGGQGFIWPKDCPYISENHVQLYRRQTKGEAMRAVEIGPYRGLSGRLNNDWLGPNEFSPVSNNFANCRTKSFGNAIEYLLEDDEVERDKRWPPGRPYPRAPVRRRLEDGGPYVL